MKEKNFSIVTLEQRPDLVDKTLRLIESSFQYQKPHSFAVDFASLIDSSNHKNCFILIEDDEVLAHVGVKELNLILSKRSFPVMLLGGIAVKEKRRGEGIFQELFQDVLAEKRSDTTFFLLWSDLEKLYNKFGFYLCGTQIEVAEKFIPSPFIKTRLKDLVPDEQKQVHELFKTSFASHYLTPLRNEQTWDLMTKVTSADLFVQKHNGRIESYYFQNKGQDLPEIIYEYGTKKDFTSFLKEISQYGKLWLGKDFLPSENFQYQFFMGPGDRRLFAEFIASYTRSAFSIREINLMKQEVFFDFNEETLVLSVEEFLRGVFGPGQFEELGEIEPLFLSGLDSI